MKNFKKIILLLFAIIMVTGCVQVESNMKITKNKKMDFEIIIAMDKSMLDNSYEDELLDDKQKEKLTNMGFEISKYNENNQVGNILTKKFDNIDYLSSTEDIKYDLNSVINDPLSTAYIFKLEKNFFKNVYTAKYDLNTILINPDLDIDYNYNLFDIIFKVSLPYKALDNNATSINNNGKELVWDMTKFNKPIEVKFNIYNTKNIIVIGIGILVILLFLINRILVLIAKIGHKNKDNKPKQNDNNKPRFIIPEDMGN